MRSDYTEVVLVLDRSGSMTSIWGDVVGGIKTFVNEQKKVEGKCLFTLFAFDDVFETVFNAVPVTEVPGVPDNVKPRGNTALIDAIAKAINSLEERICNMPEAERPGKIVLVVQTDGFENASREFTYEQVSSLIRYNTKRHDYQVLFFGANMDVIFEAKKTNIQAANAVQWTPSKVGTDKLYGGLSDKLSSYRSGGCQSMSFTPQEKTAMEDDQSPVVNVTP